MKIKNVVMMGTAFVAGIAVVGGSFAFMNNSDVQKAVDANDYNAFVASAPAGLLKKVDSQEAFDTFAAQTKEMQAVHEKTQADVLAAVQANDFEAFKQAQLDAQAAMQAMMETKQKEMFDNLVTYYKENGSLPDKGMGEGIGFGGHMGMEKGMGMGKGMSKGDRGRGHGNFDGGTDNDDDDNGNQGQPDDSTQKVTQ